MRVIRCDQCAQEGNGEGWFQGLHYTVAIKYTTVVQVNGVTTGNVANCGTVDLCSTECLQAYMSGELPMMQGA